MGNRKIEPIAFMSYSHRDNKRGQITQLRENLEESVSQLIGEEFKIFQDRESIEWGENWSQQIEESLNRVTFFIPILTPSFFNSDFCRNEFKKILAREKKLNLLNLILPIYYIDTPLLNQGNIKTNDEFIQIIASHQFVDWRELKYESYDSIKVRKMLDHLAVRIRDALNENMLQDIQKQEDDHATWQKSQVMHQNQLSHVKIIDYPPIVKRNSSDKYIEEKFSILQESMGIETLGAVVTKLIERNTILPVRKSQIFTTAADNQTSVEVNILQGERPMAKDNVSLGRFTLVGIPPAPRGIPQIEVTFEIDANGIIHVSARDMATKKEQNITITAPPRLSEEEIDAKIKDAERFAAEDFKRREEIEVNNAADSLTYASEKMLKEAGDVATMEQKNNIQKAITDLKNAMINGEISKIKAKTESLQNSIYELSAAMYQKAAEAQQK